MSRHGRSSKACPSRSRRRSRGAPEPVDAADVDAAQERDAPIDEQELAMVARLHAHGPVEHDAGATGLNSATCTPAFSRPSKNSFGVLHRAHRVVDEAHLHARFRALAQQARAKSCPPRRPRRCTSPCARVARARESPASSRRMLPCRPPAEARGCLARARAGERLFHRDVAIEDVGLGARRLRSSRTLRLCSCDSARAAPTRTPALGLSMSDRWRHARAAAHATAMPPMPRPA
jgi:hypothetical protein